MEQTQHQTPHWFPFEWKKRSRPLLAPSPPHFVSRNIYEPSVLFDGKTHLMLFRGESMSEPPTACVGRIGIGFSQNGVDFQCRAEPTLVPDAAIESRGLAHPRLTLAGGVFILTYAAYDGERYRLCLATSVDLRHWYRHGEVFHGVDEGIRSAAILPQFVKDGHYTMYVGGKDLRIATSSDLLNWELQPEPVLLASDMPDFAAAGIDPGPSPFLTKYGLVAILNGTDERGRVRPFAALLDPEQPGKCLAYLRHPFLTPESDWEMFGYQPMTVRTAGLSLIKDTLHLYYGGGDRCVCLATAQVPADYLPAQEGQSEEIRVKADSDEKDEEPGEEKPKICGV